MLGLGLSILGGGLLGGLLSAGAGLTSGLVGAGLNYESVKENNKEAARQFDENLAWQREQFAKMIEMQNTAHQREVADLRAAGLNPVLSAGGSGLSSPSGVSGVSPTASNKVLDLASSLKLASDGIQSAADQALKSADLYSLTSLREAQATEALSNASKNNELTPVQKQAFLSQAQASAASARYHNTLASQADYLTPLQGALLREQTAREQANAVGQRASNRWIDRRYQWQLMTEAAKRDFMAGMLKVNQVNAARGIFNSVRDTLKPTFKPRFRVEQDINAPSDYLGDLIFNK